MYTWNARNQLIKVEKQDDTNTSVKTLEFTYDALGRRASKTTNNITQNYLYDGEAIIAILDSNNNPISIITHDESIDTPLSIRTNNESYFYQRDHQGSITNLTDSNQNKVQEYDYTDAYGTTQVTQTLNTNNPYAYTGRELDDTDLYYYRARYYDPSTQRFLSQDPIGFASGDFNFYRYVGNSPGNFRDPSGLWIAQAIGAGIGLGFEGYSQYKSGNFNLGRLAMAGLTGAWGGFGGFAGGIARGALAGAANNGYQQLGGPCPGVDPNALARAAAFGAFGGFTGGAIGKAGKNMYRPVDVFKYPINKMPASNYGTAGTAAGAAVGGGIANQ